MRLCPGKLDFVGIGFHAGQRDQFHQPIRRGMLPTSNPVVKAASNRRMWGKLAPTAPGFVGKAAALFRDACKARVQRSQPTGEGGWGGGREEWRSSVHR